MVFIRGRSSAFIVGGDPVIIVSGRSGLYNKNDKLIHLKEKGFPGRREGPVPPRAYPIPFKATRVATMARTMAPWARVRRSR